MRFRILRSIDQGNGNEVLSWRISGGTSGGADGDLGDCCDTTFRARLLGTLHHAGTLRQGDAVFRDAVGN
jgi:hypothetical protein